MNGVLKSRPSTKICQLKSSRQLGNEWILLFFFFFWGGGEIDQTILAFLFSGTGEMDFQTKSNVEVRITVYSIFLFWTTTGEEDVAQNLCESSL